MVTLMVKFPTDAPQDMVSKIIGDFRKAKSRGLYKGIEFIFTSDNMQITCLEEVIIEAARRLTKEIIKEVREQESFEYKKKWNHCNIHNIDYPNLEYCPLCKKATRDPDKPSMKLAG